MVCQEAIDDERDVKAAGISVKQSESIKIDGLFLNQCLLIVATVVTAGSGDWFLFVLIINSIYFLPLQDPVKPG